MCNMMDSDRLETTMALQRNATASSKEDEEEEEEEDCSSNNNKDKKKTNNNRDNTIKSRYESDMEQAFAMKRASAAAAASKQNNESRSSARKGSAALSLSSSSSSSQRRLLTVNDIRLGMTGLEKAGELARQQEDDKKLEEALRIYELSLELLIRYLQSPDDSSANVNLEYDRSFIETLVKIALTDAESVKATLKARATSAAVVSKNKNTLQSSAESTREKNNDDSHGAGADMSSYFSGLVDLLSSACKVTSPTAATTTTKSTTTTNDVTANKTSTGKMTRSTAQQQIIQSRPSAATAMTITTTTTRKSAATRRPTAPSSLGASASSSRRSPASATAATAAAATSLKSSSSASNNELRQIILNDFLVPPHSLQKTTWSDIAGLDSVKQSLQETAILPLVRPDLFTGLRRPQNILLYGPPGTGKTMLVRAVAHESQSCLFCCSASSLTSKWMGEAEKLVKTLFQVAAEQASPSLIFMDEVDALLSRRKSDGEHEASRRLKTEFMIQMEGISSSNSNQNSHVLVLACTNCPWDVDSAVLRRFPRRIHVPLPDAAARAGMLEHLLQQAGKHSITKQQLSSLVNRLDGFSCSDISAIASEAAFGPIRDLDIQSVRSIHASKVRPISMQDFETAMKNATKTVTEAQLRRYQDWQHEQGASTS